MNPLIRIAFSLCLFVLECEASGTRAEEFLKENPEYLKQVTQIARERHYPYPFESQWHPPSPAIGMAILLEVVLDKTTLPELKKQCLDLLKRGCTEGIHMNAVAKRLFPKEYSCACPEKIWLAREIGLQEQYPEKFKEAYRETLSSAFFYNGIPEWCVSEIYGEMAVQGLSELESKEELGHLFEKFRELALEDDLPHLSAENFYILVGFRARLPGKFDALAQELLDKKGRVVMRARKKENIRQRLEGTPLSASAIVAWCTNPESSNRDEVFKAICEGSAVGYEDSAEDLLSEIPGFVKRTKDVYSVMGLLASSSGEIATRAREEIFKHLKTKNPDEFCVSYFLKQLGQSRPAYVPACASELFKFYFKQESYGGLHGVWGPLVEEPWRSSQSQDVYTLLSTQVRMFFGMTSNEDVSLVSQSQRKDFLNASILQGLNHSDPIIRSRSIAFMNGFDGNTPLSRFVNPALIRGSKTMILFDVQHPAGQRIMAFDFLRNDERAGPLLEKAFAQIIELHPTGGSSSTRESSTFHGQGTKRVPF